MRIPAEALSLYRAERTATLLDPRAAQPVSEAARLDETLSKPLLQGHFAAPDEVSPERRRQAIQDWTDAKDGRRGERRKSKQQVLIDTRLAARRRADGKTAIDVIV